MRFFISTLQTRLGSHLYMNQPASSSVSQSNRSPAQLQPDISQIAVPESPCLTLPNCTARQRNLELHI